MKWLPPIIIVLFGFLYWEINYVLRLRMFSKEKKLSAKFPSDRWMGPCTAILLLPLIPIYRYAGPSAISVFFSASLPIVVAISLGLLRSRYSAAAILIQSAHGGGIAFLTLINGLSSIQSCINLAVATKAEQRIEALGYCAEMTRFWINLWITLTIALITVFGGAVISIYLLKPQDYGSKLKEERQVRAILYSVSIVWMLLAGFMSVGVPALQYISRLADLQKFFGNSG
jgi:hypothetical protein